MRRATRRWMWLPAALMALGACSPTVVLGPGDAAPDFQMPGSDGATHRLADLKGRTVVIAWFPKSFTSGCTAECRSLRANSQAIRAYDVALYAASTQDAETNRKFAESLELDYPILSDPDGEVAERYGVLMTGVPLARRWTFYIGPDGRILHIDKDVQSANHGQHVVEQLERLGTPRRPAEGAAPSN